MRKFEVLGEELWEVNALEARHFWRSHPADRWRLWLHSEIDDHLLDSPAQIAECIEQKKSNPGIVKGFDIQPHL